MSIILGGVTADPNAYTAGAAAKAAGKRLHATVLGNRSITAQGVTIGALATHDSATSTSIGSATFTAADDLVTTASAHGLAVGDRIKFGTLTGVAGISAGSQLYYVRTVPSATTFTVSGSLGGATQNITADGTTVAVWKREPAYDRDVPGVNRRFQITGTRAVQADPNFPRRDNIKPDPTIVTYAPGALTGTALDVSTQYDGAALDVLVRNGGGTKRVYVDGLLAATVTNTDLTNAGITGGNIARLPLTFTDARRRTILVSEESGSAEFVGFDLRAPFSLAYPNAEAKGPRALMVGDSFTEGTGVTNGFPMARWLSWLMNWPDLWRAGSGSTGYLFDGTRTSLVDRYQNDIIAQAPDIVIIALGLNDDRATGTDRTNTVNAATTVWDAVITGLPKAELVIVGPWPNGGGTGVVADLVTLDTMFKSAAESRGLRYVSPIAEGWTFSRADATHPDDAGHEYLAWRLAGHLAVPYLPAA